MADIRQDSMCRVRWYAVPKTFRQTLQTLLKRTPKSPIGGMLTVGEAETLFLLLAAEIGIEVRVLTNLP